MNILLWKYNYNHIFNWEILKVLVNLKRIERWPYNKEMDISDLIKQASNHEQPLKRENPTQNKTETRP
jgi:hypothetical protein